MARSPNNPKRAARFYQRKTSQDRHHEPTKGPTAHDLTTRLFGIDFWHAVEFSRIKRAPPQTFRPSVGATVLTYPLGRRTVNFGCQPRGAVSLRHGGDRLITLPGLWRALDHPAVRPRCNRARAWPRDVQRQ